MYIISHCSFRTVYHFVKSGILSIGLAMAIVGCATLNQPSVPQSDPADKRDEAEPSAKDHSAKTENEITVTPPKSIAAWIPKGSGAFVIDTNRVFHGIGGAKSSSNPILLRVSADNHSRKELSNILTRFTTFVLEIYWNKDGGRESSDVGNFKVLTDAFLAVAQKTLSTSRIAGHWQDPISGKFYALCQLTLAELKAAVAADTRLERRSREYFLQNADSLYDQFSQAGGVVAS